MFQNLTENIIIFDYLSFVSHIHNEPYELVALLGLEGCEWQEIKGSKGYRQRIYFDCISIFYDGLPNQGIWVEMTGQGCRAFETYGHGDFDYLFDLILDSKGMINVTRLDVAYDDHVGLLPLNKICDDLRNSNYISKFRSNLVTYGTGGNSAQIGSMSSSVFFRVYDKKMQLHLEDDIKHWVRFELQLRDDRAFQFLLNLQCNSIGHLFFMVINNYVRFVVPNQSETNKSRWKNRKYWDKFLENSDKISLYIKPKVDYNLTKLKDYVFNQAGNAIDCAMDIYGIEKFVEILVNQDRCYNPKYDELKRKIFGDDIILLK